MDKICVIHTVCQHYTIPISTFFKYLFKLHDVYTQRNIQTQDYVFFHGCTSPANENIADVLCHFIQISTHISDIFGVFVHILIFTRIKTEYLCCARERCAHQQTNRVFLAAKSRYFRQDVWESFVAMLVATNPGNLRQNMIFP